MLALKQLQDSAATTGQVPQWNGSAWVPVTITNTLDGAYDGGGSGAGRVITADAGAVHIDKSPNDATNAFEVSVTAGSGAAIYANLATGATGFLLQLQFNTANVLTMDTLGNLLMFGAPSNGAVSTWTSNTTSGSAARVQFVASCDASQGNNYATMGITSSGFSGQGSGSTFRASQAYFSSGPSASNGIAIWTYGSSQPIVFGVDENHQGSGLPGQWAFQSAGSPGSGYFAGCSNQVFGFTGSTSDPTAAITSSLSQVSSAVIALGNGTAGNASGTLQLTTLVIEGTATTYGGVTTAGVGIASVRGSGTYTAQSAVQSSVASFTPGATATFRVSYWTNIATSPTGNLSATITYQDENGNAQTQTLPLTNASGATTNSAVTGAGTYYGEAVIRANNTAITVVETGTLSTAHDGGATIEQTQ